jgi:hypothetical protein
MKWQAIIQENSLAFRSALAETRFFEHRGQFVIIELDGFVNLALPALADVPRAADHAAAVALRQCAWASDRKVRSVDRETR